MYNRDIWTDRQTDRRQTKWSLCAAILRRRHKNMYFCVIYRHKYVILFWFYGHRVFFFIYMYLLYAHVGMSVRLSHLMQPITVTVECLTPDFKLGNWVELNWLFNVTINDISVIYVTAHRCAGVMKKLDLWSGSQRHRNFVGFFKVPVQAPTQDQSFYTLMVHIPLYTFFFCTCSPIAW